MAIEQLGAAPTGSNDAATKTYVDTGAGLLKRQVATITTPTTLGAANNTEYLTYLSASDTTVVALLHGDGSNNSTTITDSSYLGANWTVTGTAKLSTATKKFGTASISLAAGDTAVSSAATSNFGFGTGDFTIELWVYFNSVGASQNIYLHGTGGASDPVIYLSAAGKIIYYVGSDRITGGTTISAMTWYHVAVSRSGTSTKLFVNGTQEGSTYTDSTNYASNGVAQVGFSTAGMAGFVDDVRVTKGVARYTSNFTAPTAALTNPTIGTPTLPTAVGSSSVYVLKNVSPAGSISVATTSSQTIDGGTLSIGPGSTVRLDSDGANWRTAYAPANIPTSALVLGGAATAFVATAETSTLVSAVGDLATTTDQVTVTIGNSGIALVSIACGGFTSASNVNGYVTFAVSGATTIAGNGVRYGLTITPNYIQSGASWLVTGLNPGSNTFKMKYGADATGTVTFMRRTISVIPL